MSRHSFCCSCAINSVIRMCYVNILTIGIFIELVGSLNQSKIYDTTSCAILGGNDQEIRCVQHVIIDKSSYCTPKHLQELFPHLYDKPNTLKIPGPVTLYEPQYSNITWSPSQDGSIFFLKGFQIIQSGSDMSVYGKKQCAVIDLSNFTETQARLLPKLKFSIDFRQPGGYSIEIQPLPLGTSNNTKLTQLTQNPIYEVYHPNLEVTTTYKQTNQTCVNILLLLLPEIKDVDQILIDTSYNGSWLQDMSGPIPYNVLQYIPLCDLSPGNYTLEISLLDKYVFDSEGNKCTCYKGTPELHTCTQCKKYTRTFYVTNYRQPITSVTGDNQVLTITLATLVPVLATAAMATMLFLLFCRRSQGRVIHCTGHKKQDETKPMTVYLLFSNDHEAHDTVVQSFIQYLQCHFVCSVKTVDCQSNQMSSDSLRLGDIRSRDTGYNHDVIIVVHSEYLHHLASEYELAQQLTDRKQPEDVRIIQEMTQIKTNPMTSDKTISIYFNYTDKAFVNLLSEEPLNFLPLQIHNMQNHLKSKFGFKERVSDKNGTAGSNEKENNFISAIHRANEYQKYHPNWLTVKLFNMQQSCSSDDSGIIISNGRTRQRRSVRSKSADTVCKCEMSLPTSDCINCNKIRPRRHSFDYSFYAPETVSDDVSVRLSLLESRLVAFNDRYDYIVGNSNRQIISDDYLSVGGESV